MFLIFYTTILADLVITKIIQEQGNLNTTTRC